MEVNSNNK
jgi:sulfonate dioxygenase